MPLGRQKSEVEGKARNAGASELTIRLKVNADEARRAENRFRRATPSNIKKEKTVSVFIKY